MLERWLKPRTEHPDPEVRKQAFAQLAVDDPAYLAAVVGDADAGVRAELLARLDDAAVLARRASEDADDSVRMAARERLVVVLCAAGSVDADARYEVVAGLQDPELLQRVVREATDARLREAAFAGLLAHDACDTPLLEALACHDADSDLRSRAVDHLGDVEALDRVAVAVRKSDKDLHRRARDKIRAIHDNEEKAHSRRQHVDDILALAERPLEAQNDAMHRRMARLQHWRDGWSRVADGDDEAAVAQALAGIEGRLDEVRALVSERRAILDEVGQIPDAGEDDAVLAAFRQRWAALPDHRDADHDLFERALQRHARRAREANRVARARASAETLLGEWEGMDWSKTVVDDSRRQHLEEHWTEIALPEGADDSLIRRYRALRDRLRDAQTRQGEASATAAEEALALVEALAKDLAEGRSAEATSARDKLNHRLSHGIGLPKQAEQKIRKRLASLEPELRKLKEWRHWGADRAREQLCTEAEALAAQAKDIKASKLARRVKTLRDRWQAIDKGVGAAQAKLWTRFDTACEAAYAPAKEVFDKQAEERRANAERKRGLCEKLEHYVRDTDWSAPDWDAAVAVLDAVRREWREVGGVSHRQFSRLRERYRAAVAALDAQLDEERQREVRRRELAIAALRNLTEREPLGEQIQAAKRVQREWKPRVRANRKKEQALWNDLRAVCDAIFAQRDEQTAARRQQESGGREAREALIAEIDGLLTGEVHDEAAVNQASGRDDAIRKAWRDAGPVAPRQRKALDSRYRQSGKSFEQRRDTLRKREHEKLAMALLERALLAEERRQRLALGGDADALNAPWEALPDLRGAAAKRLQAAWDDARPATPDADKLAVKRDLCLRLELMADVPSPPEHQAERMALKIAMLQDSLAGDRGGDRDATWHDLLFAWVDSAPVDGAEWDGLRQRFEVAARAFKGQS